MQSHAPTFRTATEQKLDRLQAMGVNETNKKPQVFRIRRLGQTSQHHEVVNPEREERRRKLSKTGLGRNTLNLVTGTRVQD